MNTSEDVIYSFNWYPNELPKKGDTVIIRKVCIDEMGAWVDLLEYGCKRGFIPITCAKKCHKLGQRQIKMGKIALATVFQIDNEKNNIDLKHYTLKDENVKNAEKRFYDYRKLLKLLYHVSLKSENVQYQDLLKQIVYPLHEKYGNAYQYLLKSYNEPEIISKLSVPEDIKNYIIEQIERIHNQPKVRIFGLFEAQIFNPDHLCLLNQALASAKEMEKDIIFDDPFFNTEKENKAFKLNINNVKDHLYSISIDVFNIEQGISFVSNVIRKIEKKIVDADGKFVIKKEPKVIKQEEMKIEIDRFTDDSNENDEKF